MKKKNKLVYSVGINDADYAVQRYIATDCIEDGKRKRKLVWICPFYLKWKHMLARCYSVKLQEKRPSYKGCSVCDEWLTFSKFKSWMEKQEWEGKQLDKDLLIRGNKVYSAETCVFVDGKVNLFLTEHNAARGQWMIGVDWICQLNKFRAKCNDGAGKHRHLGLFQTEIEAHLAWLKFKQELALKLAAEQTDARVANALIGRYQGYAIDKCLVELGADRDVFRFTDFRLI